MDPIPVPTQPIVPVAPAIPAVDTAIPAIPPMPAMAPPSFLADFTPPPDVAAISQQATSTRDMAARLVNALTAPGAAMPPIPTPPAPDQVPPPPAPVSFAPQPATSARYSDAPFAEDAPPPLPDIPPEQNIVITQNTPDNIGHAFAASRAEARQFRQLAEQMKQQLEAERAQSADWSSREDGYQKQLEELRQSRDELADVVGQLDLTRDPRFRARYDRPLQDVQDRIAQALFDSGYSEADADEGARQLVLADSDDRDVSQLGLPPEAVGKIAYCLQEADGLWAERAQALSDWQNTRTGVEEYAERDYAEQNAAYRADIVDRAVEKALTIAPTLQWDDAEYAPRRDAAVTRAKAWYQNAPDEQIAAAAIEGFMAPFAYEVIDRLKAEVNDLRGRLAGRVSLSAPPVAPLYSSQPLPQPATPPPPPQAVPWTPVSQAGNTNAMALQLVQGLLAKN